MTTAHTRWSKSYLAALREHLADGSKASLRPALSLGRRAAALGLETLDVANFHEQAQSDLVPPRSSLAFKRQHVRAAKRFYTETIVPIEKTHRAAQQRDKLVDELTQKLRQRTLQSNASALHLERNLAKRKAAERALKRSGKKGLMLLRNSSHQQNRLRHETRSILVQQEERRNKDSRRLHDEIAQTLMAINLRLLSLKLSAKGSTEKLEREIAETQRVVRQSVQTIKQLSQEFGKSHEV